MLGTTDGVKAPSVQSWLEGAGPSQGTFAVTVDAPTMEQAEAKLKKALAPIGSFSVARPEALEDDED